LDYTNLRPKEVADDWVWIADHVISKGVYKCLVVLGVRMSSLLKKGDLTVSLEDVEPLGIVPMRSSNGELMEAEFEEILQANHGIPPLAIVKDQGSDIRCGGRRFCEAHPGVIDIHDVPHKIARMYAQQLEEDDSWNEFSKQCADFKKQVQLTEYSDISPPNQRSKARFHNIDVLVDWAQGLLLKYNDLSSERQGKLQWVKKHEKNLEYWGQLVDIGRETRDFIRKRGLSLDCYDLLGDLLAQKELCPRAEQFGCKLIDFIEEEGKKVPEGKCVVGSSEIIESLFGKHKSISEKGPKPMGRLILSMASRVGEIPTEALVQAAFEAVKESHVAKWLKKMFC